MRIFLNVGNQVHITTIPLKLPMFSKRLKDQPKDRTKIANSEKNQKSKTSKHKYLRLGSK